MLCQCWSIVYDSAPTFNQKLVFWVLNNLHILRSNATLPLPCKVQPFRGQFQTSSLHHVHHEAEKLKALSIVSLIKSICVTDILNESPFIISYPLIMLIEARTCITSKSSAGIGLILVQCRRRWPSIEPTLCHCFISCYLRDKDL